MICPYCNTNNEKSITISNLGVFNCSNCGGVYYDKRHKFIGKLTIPNLEIGDYVMCIDNRHPLFLQYGFVKELDHLHARILFKKVLIWMNSELIAKLPD